MGLPDTLSRKKSRPTGSGTINTEFIAVERTMTGQEGRIQVPSHGSGEMELAHSTNLAVPVSSETTDKTMRSRSISSPEKRRDGLRFPQFSKQPPSSRPTPEASAAVLHPSIPEAISKSMSGNSLPTTVSQPIEIPPTILLPSDSTASQHPITPTSPPPHYTSPQSPQPPLRRPSPSPASAHPSLRSSKSTEASLHKGHSPKSVWTKMVNIGRKSFLLPQYNETGSALDIITKTGATEWMIRRGLHPR
ncbi:hypothetical protein HK097_003994, partial [Rhizophlyctis rosea]